MLSVMKFRIELKINGEKKYKKSKKKYSNQKR